MPMRSQGNSVRSGLCRRRGPSSAGFPAPKTRTYRPGMSSWLPLTCRCLVLPRHRHSKSTTKQKWTNFFV